ncbi:MAG: hypothetical protein EOP86_18645, partial [Verrucomicrobiaceae bacterium]
MILRQFPHAALLLFSLLSVPLSLPVRLDAAPRAEVVDEEDAPPVPAPAQRPDPAPLLPGPPVPNPSPASTASPLNVPT